MKRPYAWHPSIIDTQLLRIGDFVVAALPGEFTVMSGRRMRNMLKAAAVGYPVSNVALSGLNNMYTHYVTTPEEYGGQVRNSIYIFDFGKFLGPFWGNLLTC